MNIGFSWEGYALPNPPAREGCGETGFPHTPTAVGGAWRPSRQGDGEPGFPISEPLLGAAGAPTGRGMGKPGFPVFSHPKPSPRAGCFLEGLLSAFQLSLGRSPAPLANRGGWEGNQNAPF